MTKRIGRPPNEAGHKYQTIGISGTPQEIASVLYSLTPRQRMEAILAAISPAETDPDNDDDRERWAEYTRYNPSLIFTTSD